MDAIEINSFVNQKVTVTSFEDTRFTGFLRQETIGEDWYYIEFEKGVRIFFGPSHIKQISPAPGTLGFVEQRRYERKPIGKARRKPSTLDKKNEKERRIWL